MDLEEIKELMEAMKDHDFNKVSVKHESGFSVDLERGGEIQTLPFPAVQQMAPAQVETVVQEKITMAEEQPAQEEKKAGHEITSPMVGSFYASPSPEDEPFVKVGDTVNEDTVLCIIEAMKVMNEVKAGVSGVVAEITASNGQAVEFGTKLFRVVPS